jgi:hypothetical protein
MNKDEISKMAKQMAEELSKLKPEIVTTANFPVGKPHLKSDCLDKMCEDAICPQFIDRPWEPYGRFYDIDIYVALSKLKPDELKKVFEAANIIKKLRDHK